MAEVKGRPVAVEIVTREHAILSASSAERWLVCTPSARIENGWPEDPSRGEGLPDQPSEYAMDGTAAHAFSELRLRYLLKHTTHDEYVAAYEANLLLYAEHVKLWTQAEWDSIDQYVDYVMNESVRLDAEVYIEARVDYSMYAQGGFGTSDALLVSRTQHIIKSIDLKFGKGVMVSARNNPQAKLYALGGLIKYDPKHQMTQVEWAIVQPRLDYVGEGGDSVVNMIEWAERIVAPAAALAWEGKGDLKPSPKGCRFCKANATCRARAAENVLIARRDFMQDLSQMDAEEIGRILPHLEQWKAWANQVEKHALEMARDKNIKIPGHKLVRGRSSRKWDEGKDVAAILRSKGVSETDMMEEPSLRSVAQMEKKLGKKRFTELAEANSLVTIPPGTPALVSEDDDRPAINKVAEAAALFDKPQTR